jgi:polyhydroxyalkanoate synthase subunit PhaE
MIETDYMKVLSDAWATTGNALTAAQQRMFKDMAEQMRNGFMFPFQVFAVGEAGAPRADDAFRQFFLSALRIPETIGNALASAKSADGVTADLLQRILDPKAWLSATGPMDETVRRVVEGPKLADLGQTETRFLSLMKAWTETRTYSIEHSAHLLTAWAKAAGAFGAKLNEAAAGRPLSSRSEAIALWVEIANEHLFEVQRSAPFLETQRNLLRASSALKRAQQELSEFYGETLGLPTRSEIDDLTRTVAELKREFRADRRQRKRASTRGRSKVRASA